MHIIFDSSGLELHFPDDESYQQFKEAEKALYVEHYGKIRAKHGIWAGNQCKFVQTPEDLNEWDGNFMERLWRAKQGTPPESKSFILSWDTSKPLDNDVIQAEVYTFVCNILSNVETGSVCNVSTYSYEPDIIGVKVRIK